MPLKINVQARSQQLSLFLPTCLKKSAVWAEPRTYLTLHMAAGWLSTVVSVWHEKEWSLLLPHNSVATCLIKLVVWGAAGVIQEEMMAGERVYLRGGLCCGSSVSSDRRRCQYICHFVRFVFAMCWKLQSLIWHGDAVATVTSGSSGNWPRGHMITRGIFQ